MQITAIHIAEILQANHHKWHMLRLNQDTQDSRKEIGVNKIKKKIDMWDILRSTYKRLYIGNNWKPWQKQAFAYEKETELNQRFRTLQIEMQRKQGDNLGNGYFKTC